jgi:ABC-2 type transport system permease protein
MVVLCITGGAFMAMGLFFSSLTQNQVASAVLTFAGMILFFGIHFLWRQLSMTAPGSAWVAVTSHMNYILLWINSMDGILIPKYLLFHVSITIVWLFLAVKVLEARRWA